MHASLDYCALTKGMHMSTGRSYTGRLVFTLQIQNLKLSTVFADDEMHSSHDRISNS